MARRHSASSRACGEPQESLLITPIDLVETPHLKSSLSWHENEDKGYKAQALGLPQQRGHRQALASWTTG
jgi:hypothetical protein